MRKLRIQSILLVFCMLLAHRKAVWAQDPSSQKAWNEERITRIEHGLVPNSVVKGEPFPKYSVEEGIKHYRVPGLSVTSNQENFSFRNF